MELKLKLAQTKKLSFGRYPYTYARTAVMKSLLLKKADYHKMLKMGFSEIAKSLQDTSYKKEINELANNYEGADLLELALNRNLAESFKKLIRISPNELGLLIKEYAKRKDIEDIKTILRGKFTNADEKEVLMSITGAGTLSHDFLASLLKKDSIEKVLKENSLVEFSALKEGLKNLNEKNNLIAIENQLDKYYYTHLMQFSKTLPKGALFRDFLLSEIEMLNIMTLLRLKKASFEKNAINGFLIYSGDKLKDQKIASLARLENLEELLGALSKTQYKDAISRGLGDFKKNGSIISLETELYKHLLKKSALFMHQHPLSVDVILGYMFAKEIEVRNLKIIIKGKQLGLKDEFIENQLIF